MFKRIHRFISFFIFFFIIDVVCSLLKINLPLVTLGDFVLATLLACYFFDYEEAPE